MRAEMNKPTSVERIEGTVANVTCPCGCITRLCLGQKADAWVCQGCKETLLLPDWSESPEDDPAIQTLMKELVVGEECLVMSILLWGEARLPLERVVQYMGEYRDAYIRLRDICPTEVAFFPAVESMLLEEEES